MFRSPFSRQNFLEKNSKVHYFPCLYSYVVNLKEDGEDIAVILSTNNSNAGFETDVLLKTLHFYDHPSCHD